MSNSYHTTWKDVKGKTKKELEEMTSDPDSVLNDLVAKRKTKKKVKEERKATKEDMKNEL